MPTANGLDSGSDLAELARAKINLTLRVVGRRADGYHELDSLVAFANIGDRLTLSPRRPLALSVNGPLADGAGPLADNLVLTAARTLVDRVGGLMTGPFVLDKQLPAGAGLGGGSADAAAALRLLARANGLDPNDQRLADAARASGADVPVCLAGQARFMRGIGDELGDALPLPHLPAVLAFPGVPLSTRAVFEMLHETDRSAHGSLMAFRGDDGVALLNFLDGQVNDLEQPAIKLVPLISVCLAALRAQPGCDLARMSGSGSACFGLFQSSAAAAAAASALAKTHPAWWVRATTLAG